MLSPNRGPRSDHSDTAHRFLPRVRESNDNPSPWQAGFPKFPIDTSGLMGPRCISRDVPARSRLILKDDPSRRVPRHGTSVNVQRVRNNGHTGPGEKKGGMSFGLGASSEIRILLVLSFNLGPSSTSPCAYTRSAEQAFPRAFH